MSLKLWFQRVRILCRKRRGKRHSGEPSSRGETQRPNGLSEQEAVEETVQQRRELDASETIRRIGFGTIREKIDEPLDAIQREWSPSTLVVNTPEAYLRALGEYLQHLLSSFVSPSFMIPDDLAVAQIHTMLESRSGCDLVIAEALNNHRRRLPYLIDLITKHQKREFTQKWIAHCFDEAGWSRLDLGIYQALVDEYIKVQSAATPHVWVPNQEWFLASPNRLAEWHLQSIETWRSRQYQKEPYGTTGNGHK